MSQETKYTEDNIRSLDWKEHIRMRPGMYIGKLGDGSSADDGIYILLKEVFTQTQRYPNSFPSFLPGLSLDRIFYKNLKLIEATQINDKKYRNLSDHLPLLAHFKL